MRSWACVIVATALGCSSSSPSSTVRPERSGPRRRAPAAKYQVAAGQAGEPIRILVEGTRVGSSVRLDIVGMGRGRARHAMERAENWTVQALAGDRQLDRMVNGSVKVERAQVGNPRDGIWDIEVRFSVAFAVPPDETQLTVRITAPGSGVFERELEIQTAGQSTKQRKARPGKSRKR